MKIKLTFYVLAAFFIVDFSLADNEVKRRRPIIDSAAQDSDGNYIDQLAQDSAVNSKAENVAAAPDGYRGRYHTATDEFRKQPAKTAKSEKVHYVTPEPYQNNFSQDYVHHALKTHEKTKDNSPASSFLEYTSQTHDDPRRPANLKRKKIPSTDFEDYNYLFQESKRLTARSTYSPAKVGEKTQKPTNNAPAKEKKATESETVHNYHYYYPDESQKVEKNNFNYPSSTAGPYTAHNPSTRGPSYLPSSTQSPKIKYSSKKKTPAVQIQQTSTDSYQYPPVLQRPSEYTPTDFSNQDFMPLYETKTFFSQSTAAPSTASPIKMLKPTKKNNFYPSSTMSPSSPRPNIRRPSTESPYQDVKSFSVSPSPSAVTRFSTTRAPEVYKYSSPASVSSTGFNDYYIKSSTQATPSASPSPNYAYESDHTVVIKPKTQYNNFENYEPKQEVNEQIIYKFVPQETFNHGPNKTDFQSSSTFPSFPDYYKNLNTTTQADMDFYNSFHKNYNYEFFTEHDAGPMNGQRSFEADFTDDKQRASKKNMMFPINQHESDYEHRGEYQQNDYYPSENFDHEMQPPMSDNDADASKNKYIVLYSVDDEENERQRKFTKKKTKQQEPEAHTRPHYTHSDKAEDFPQFDSEFDSEFDTDLVNSDNVRIVDPKIKGGRPLEFTKEDYLRHIRQAVVQYMREQQKDTQAATSNIKLKTERYQEFETPLRPTKTPAASAPSYKQQPKQYKPTKLPKNIPPRSKEPVDDMLESPQVDLTSKKHRQKPFDPSAIDVGQSYQHVTHFDHSSAVRNAEEFDPSEAVQQSKAKLHFSQQTYHDINNLGNHQKQKKQHHSNEDTESDMVGQNVFKNYQFPKKYSTKVSHVEPETYESVNHETYKHPRYSQPQTDQYLTDEDDEDNKVEDPVDAPIQIINGFPVSNPYNIDLNTLKYMLGGIAQAEVNDQNKDNEDNQNLSKYPQDWKAYSFGSQPSADTVYPSYDQAEPTQRPRKHVGQGEPQHRPKNQQMQQNNNRGSSSKQQQQTQNRPKTSGGKQQFVDFSGWTNKNKKLEPQGSSQANTYVLRPITKNKHARDESMKIQSHKGAVIRHRPNLSTDMRPPPPLPQRLRVVKVL